MSDWLERTTRLNLAGMVLTIVAALVLSSCGIGDDDDADATSTSEPAGVTTQVAQVSGTRVSPSASLTSTERALDGAAGTPGSSSASPTPGIVVSAPPIAMPTEVPGPSTAATPASGERGAASTQAVISSDVTVGDGTGGASATVVGAGSELTPAGAPSPGASPVSGDATASSCAYTAYPSFTGDSAEQETTVDVNVRAGPGQDCDVIGEPIAAGVTVQVLSDPVQRAGDDEFQWVFVSIDGAEGWLTTEALEPVASS